MFLSLLKLQHWNLIPYVTVFGAKAFGKSLSHEGRVLMNGISLLMNETTESLLNSLDMWDTKRAGVLILNFSVSWTVKK